MRIYKYRLYPTPEQEQILNDSLTMCSRLWNTALAYNEQIYRESKQLIPAKVGYTAFFESLKPAYNYRLQNIQDILPMMKQYEKLTGLNRLDIIHSQPYQEVLQRLDKAYKEFFEGTRKRPRYKKSHNYKSMTFTQYGSACHIPTRESGEEYNAKSSKKSTLHLSKVGDVCMIYHRPLPENAKVKQAIVKRMPSGRWFVSFMVDTNVNNIELDDTDKVTAYDRGLRYLLADSDGGFVESPRVLAKYAGKIAKISRKLARSLETTKITYGLKRKSAKKLARSRGRSKYAHLIKPEGKKLDKKNYHVSNRYLKLKVKRAKTYERVADIRDDFTHKLSKRMVKENKTIIFENLKVANMAKNHKLAKSILDASWTSLSDKTDYKAESAGRKFELEAPHYSSQECNICHHIDKNNRLTQSKFVCLRCGHSENADTNAAKVLKYRYLTRRIGSTESINVRQDSVTTQRKSEQTRLLKRKEAPAITHGV